MGNGGGMAAPRESFMHLDLVFSLSGMDFVGSGAYGFWIAGGGQQPYYGSI